MTKSVQQQHIDKLFTQKSLCDRNSTTLTHTLEKDIGTAFKGGGKFLLELLQNADDSTAQTVKISIAGQQLILEHDGVSFSKTDVKKICDNAQQQHFDKSVDQNKTGYKGIGFKSVFAISDQVHIVSSGYSFRFDKNYFAGTRTPKSAHPWPIIPIWTDILEDSQFEPSKTYFIINIKPGIDLTAEIDLLMQDYKIILFLRHVSYLELKHDDRLSSIGKIRNLADSTYSLQQNGHTVSTWLVQSYTIPIPAETAQALNLLSDIECPQRLKAAREASFQLAIRKEDGGLRSEPEGKLYCYLPTEMTRAAIPVLVNSDFLLNAERTQLIENVWNQFLLNQLPTLLFTWMAELALTDFRDHILAVMPDKSIKNLPFLLTKSYEEGYLAALDTAFIPLKSNPSHLLKISEAYQDSLSFYKHFPELDLPLGFVRDELINPQKLNFSIARIFKGEDLINRLVSYVAAHKTIEFQIRLLGFLSSHLPAAAYPSLKNLAFLLDQSGCLASPKTVYFDHEDKQLTDLVFLSPVLYENRNLKQYLINLGVQEIDNHKIINDHIIRRLKERNLDRLLEGTHYLIQHQHTLTEIAWNNLKSHLQVFTLSGGLKAPSSLYFMPAEKNAVYDNLNFIDLEKYGAGLSTKNFFKKAGVKLPTPEEIIREHIIPRLRQQDVDRVLEDTLYLIQYQHTLTEISWNNLKSHLQVFTLSRELKAPSSLYFMPDGENSVYHDLNFIDLEKYGSALNTKNFFKKAGVKLPVPEEIIREYILKRLDASGKEQLIQDTQYIFQNAAKLNGNDWALLKEKLCFYTKSQKKIKVESCYLSSEISEQLGLEEDLRLGGNHFIDLDLYGSKQETQSAFRYLDVKSPTNLKIIKDFILPRMSQLSVDELIRDTTFIFEHKDLLYQTFREIYSPYSRRYEPKTGWQILQEEINFVLENASIKKNQIYLRDEYSALIEDDPRFTGFFIDFQRYHQGSSIAEWTGFLEKIGLKRLSKSELIKDYILPRLASDHQDALIRDTIFIFENQKALDLQDWVELKKSIKIVTKTNALIPAQRAYLATEYHPKIDLEQDAASPADFVSAEYLNAGKSQEWKAFFIKVDVAQEFSLREDAIKFIHLIVNPKYTAALYQLIAENFDRIFSGKKENPLVHYLNSQAICSSDNGNYYLFSELYEPSLKSLIQSVLPIAQLPECITPLMLTRLGVKKELGSAELGTLLDVFYNQQEFKRHQKIINYIVDKNIKMNWAGYLPSEGIDWQPKDQLKYLAIPEITTNAEAHWLKKNIHPNMEKFCELFEIATLKKSDVLIQSKEPFLLDDKVKLHLTSHKRVGLIAYFQAKHMDKLGDLDQIRDKIEKTMATLNFYCADHHLILVQKTDPSLSQTLEFYQEDNDLYYLKSIKDERVSHDFFHALVKKLELTFDRSEQILTWICTLPDEELESQLVTMKLVQSSFDQPQSMVEDFEQLQLTTIGSSSSSNAHLSTVSSSLDVALKSRVANTDNAKILSLRSLPSLSFFGFDTEQKNKETGRAGEVFAYQYLKSRYEKKGYTLSEGHQHFIAQKEGKTIKVEWPNKHSETGLPYDLLLYKNGQKIYVEVKATSRYEVSWAFFSRAEVNLLVQSKEKYRVFRVYNANSSNASIKQIKNPASRLGEFLEIDDKLKLNM